MSAKVKTQNAYQSADLNASQPTQILFNIDLTKTPIKSLRALVAPTNLHGKPIVLYQKRFNGSNTVIGLIDGGQIGLGISKLLDKNNIKQLSTTVTPQPTEEVPLMYCMYYDPLYTMVSGMWELFYGDFGDFKNRQSRYFPDGDNLMDYFNCLHADDFADAYYIHHKFNGGTMADTEYVVLQGMN
jgi:hypothetical protein